jgi:hypothetical protein
MTTKRDITWKDLSKAERKRARELQIDEGWSFREAVLLSHAESLGNHRADVLAEKLGMGTSISRI